VRNFPEFAWNNNNQKMSKTATLFGASGLVGGHLLQVLLNNDSYNIIRAIVRRTLNINHPKLQEIIIDFSDPKDYEKALSGSETVFCTVGTTQKKVQGDKDAYRKVDYDIALYAAQAAAKYGVYCFVLVSSVGANAENNNNFYLKLKGVVEEAVSKQMIPQVHIMRPSLLLGNRKERRFAEKLAQVTMPAISFLLPSKYKPITAEKVALAMLEASKEPGKGIFIHDYDQMVKLVKRSV
jgi:uncharacterized protein YbjT (DUF2867 family)